MSHRRPRPADPPGSNRPAARPRRRRRLRRRHAPRRSRPVSRATHRRPGSAQVRPARPPRRRTASGTAGGTGGSRGAPGTAYDELGRPVAPGGPGGPGRPAARPAPGPRAPPPRRAHAAGCKVVAGRCCSRWLAFIVLTPVHAWSQVTREDTTPTGDRPADADGSTYLLVGLGQPRGPDRRGAQGPRRRRQRQGPAHRLDHPRAHPERLREAGAHLDPPRQLPADPRASATTRSTRRSPSAARSCSPPRSSRPPACRSTATSRSGSAGSPASSTASAASRSA